MLIDFNRAKKIAAGCLAMTSCGFALWLSQTNSFAADNTPAPVVVADQQARPSQTAPAKSQTTPAQSTNYDHADQGNYANLDSAQINDQGQLTVSGWHATNAAKDRPYHYIIAVNKATNQEIGRQNVTDQAVTRTDVQRVHNVYGADQSGFNTSFKLGKGLAKLNQVQIVSRYTNDAQENGNAVDYWFAPVTIDRNNRANLDGATVAKGQMVINGWHATNLAAGKGHHFIIVLDRTSNQEVARQLVTPVKRPDVAKAFPGIAGADESGFTVKIPLTKLNLNHQLQVISRYAGASDGNSDYVDYWFSPITSGNQFSQGYLDSFNLSDGHHLTFSGWHVDNLSGFENNHYAILYDLTARRQVAVVNTTTVNRPDVVRALPNVTGAAQSGFNGQFDLTKASLISGHSYAVVSRYSTSDQGNGDQGQYNDFWSAPVVLNQRASWLDSVKMSKQGLQIAGWMVSDAALAKKYPYVIVLNNGKEIKRAKLTLTNRPDVAARYSQVYNSAQSGFATTVPLDLGTANGTLKLILRFSNDAAGNGNFDDQYSPDYATNAGAFDQINITANSIYVSGWHASNQAVNKPYQFLIFVDQNGHELYRQEVLDKNRARTDVANAFPAIYNSGQSGYQLAFGMPNQLRNQNVRIIHRFTDDKLGNGNYVDYTSGPVSTSLMRTPIDYRMPSEYGPYPNVSHLKNFWIHVRIGQNRVYMMDGNNVVYTMYCTAGRYVNGVSLTPTGTYYVQNERGDLFDYGEHWTSWKDHGVYLFHSVVFDAPWHDGHFDQAQLRLLGVSAGSHGCIRLPIPDANWIQHNVPAGTRVVIEN